MTRRGARSRAARLRSGRVFVQVLGHDESIYKMTPMLAHILAGVQYAIGDLQADDNPLPSAKKSAAICDGSAAH